MNELFLSGTILTLVKTPTTGDTSHVVCQLRHSHCNRQQQVIHETYTESPCGLGGADAETRCAGVCQGLPDAEAAWRCYYDRGHRRAVLCPVTCCNGRGESTGKLRLLSALWLKLAKRGKLINEKLEFCGRTSGNALK